MSDRPADAPDVPEYSGLEAPATESAAPSEELAPPVPTVPWRRLDRRMLLVHPVQELIRFFPAVVVAFVVGASGEKWYWQAIGIAVPVVLGIVRYLTTRFRITPTQVELSRSLVGRTVLTARLDRVRAVELTQRPIHRALGLAAVEIGTASGGTEEKFELDGLPIADARALRLALLHRTPGASSYARAAEGHDATGATPVEDLEEAPAPDGDQVLMRLDLRWVRYAPLTASGTVIAAGLLAVLGQFTGRIGIDLFAPDGPVDTFLRLSLVVVVAAAVAAFLVVGAVFAVLGYVITNWRFTLSRDLRGRSFHVRRGLFTTTETSLERDRVRGVSLGEPLGLRLAGAARLSAIVTGLKLTERSGALLSPPAPVSVVEHVGGAVLGSAGANALSLRLVEHGPAARRRRYTRALTGLAVPVALLAALALAGPVSWWWPVVVAVVLLPGSTWLAHDRYRRLGHGLTEDHLVIRTGSLSGRRDVLGRSGIIGWNLQQSWFQRRAGIVTLVATTAAGRQAFDVVDVPEPVAIALADAATPGLLTPFLR